MNIQHELDYLSELLTAQSQANIEIGESLIAQWQNLHVPDRFETLEQANGFVLDLRGRITPTVTRLYEVIANAYNDDLGNQSIRRIRAAIGQPYLTNHWIEDRIDQSEIDMLLARPTSHTGYALNG